MSHFIFGRTPRTAASPTVCEQLERRTLLSTLVVTGTTGNDTITVGASAAGGITVTVGSKTTTYAKGQWDSVEVNTLGGDDIIGVTQTVVPTRIEATGSLSVSIGDTGGVQHINSPLVVEDLAAGAVGSATLFLEMDDTGDPASRTATLSVSNGIGRVTGLAPAEIDYQSGPNAVPSGSLHPAPINTLSIRGLSTVDIAKTLPDFAIELVGQQGLSVTVGDADTPAKDALVSPLTLGGAPLVVDASADITPQMVTVGVTTDYLRYPRDYIDGIGSVFHGIGIISGGLLTLDGGSGGNTFVIDHPQQPVKVNAGSGDDVLDLKNAGPSVDGGSGYNTLIVEGVSGLVRGAQILADSGTIAYSHIESLRLRDGSFVSDTDLGPRDLVVADGTYKFQSDQHLSSLTVGGNAYVEELYLDDTIYTNGLSFIPDPASGATTDNGVLDIGQGALKLGYGSGPNSLPAYVAAGRVISSRAGGPFAVGVGDSADGTVVGLPVHTAVARLAAIGDPDMDTPVPQNSGTYVTFKDLVILAAHYGQKNAIWDQGDFTGDGVVGFDDLVLLAQNYQKLLFFRFPQ